MVPILFSSIAALSVSYSHHHHHAEILFAAFSNLIQIGPRCGGGGGGGGGGGANMEWYQMKLCILRLVSRSTGDFLAL